MKVEWAELAGNTRGRLRPGHDYVRGLGNLHGWADGDPF
jgi:hypothetical protein